MTQARRGVRVLAAVLLLAIATPTRAEGFRVTGTAGVGTAYSHTYFVVGGRVGYDVAFGVTPELGLTYWGGSTPSFLQLAPGVTWYMPLPVLRPYVGGFYVHDFLSSGFPDQDGVGVRGGIGLGGGGPVSLLVGVAYERRLSCSVDCDTWWPEALVGVSF